MTHINNLAYTDDITYCNPHYSQNYKIIGKFIDHSKE